MLEAAKTTNILAHPDAHPGGARESKKKKHVMDFIQSVKDETFCT